LIPALIQQDTVSINALRAAVNGMKKDMPGCGNNENASAARHIPILL